MKPTWKQYLLYGSLIIAGGILAFMLLETIQAKRTGFETKTLWDWMELLIVPLVLAGGALFLNHSERDAERRRAEERAALELKISTDRQREDALQSYVAHMAELLLKEKLKTPNNEEAHNVARILTLAVLDGLDPRRKGLVLRFLKESGLIEEYWPIIDLNRANLIKASLDGARLERTHLDGANLQRATLRESRLELANLEGAHLEGINLEKANLVRARLEKAHLTSAQLQEANLQGAHLQGANLERANLQGANLKGAHLQGANLERANLQGVNLEGADLLRARVCEGQLLEAVTLERATMPDGTRHD